MDHYPQPRPVLYGTTYPEEPPQTQTQPVLTGPPRWPPAPPSAGDAPEPGDGPPPLFQRRSPSLPYYLAFGDPAAARSILAVAYAIASAYALYQAAFTPSAFAERTIAARLLILFQIMAVSWVVPCLLVRSRREYVLVTSVSTFQLLFGLLAGEWSAPGFIVALAMCVYLLRPGLLVERPERSIYFVRVRQSTDYGSATKSGRWRRAIHFFRPTREYWRRRR